MQLIPNAKNALNFWSVRLALLLVAWEALPADMKASVLALLGVPENAVSGVLALLVLVSRLILQPDMHPKPPEGQGPQ